ncbi:hypothetical protein FQN52_000615 [Onygenales sp. PD_12]|nr:hypothetical protein FQN52_000615 [Onygenales sp. PD_12]KAK2805699.1 hypothetical protein FQN51_009202 [Onygenales sp. PD_10]
MVRSGALLSRRLLAHQIFGANTNVGKTLLTTILFQANALHRPKTKSWFLKPVSTGPQDESDERHINRFAKCASSKCLYSFSEPVSPHIAARGGETPEDEMIVRSISQTVSNWAEEGHGFALVETAGGVLSPGPSGSLQADLYRPLRLPVILVGHSNLGGISTSIAAYESLAVRGYDVVAVAILEDNYYQNHTYLYDFFRRKDIPLFSLPKPPPRELSNGEQISTEKDEECMSRFYDDAHKEPVVSDLLKHLYTKHDDRLEKLESMARRAHGVIWYPFTQHSSMTARDITVIDSAFGDCFQTFKQDDSPILKPDEMPHDIEPASAVTSLLRSTFDGSASWWTQGLGHGNPELSLSAAYTAGRYGHVMFAGAIQEPALLLAENLIQSMQNPRLRRAFYSDNGSTGMEVAVKMGLRATCERYGLDSTKKQVEILGLSGSYHGDTIGTMDCSEPSVFNKRVEWYRGRGYWFDFPKVKMSRGAWVVEAPEQLKEVVGSEANFPTLDAIFNLKQRESSKMGRRYKSHIKQILEELTGKDGRTFGALIMEPVILGAGGMLFAQVVRENPGLFGQGQKHAPDPIQSSQGNRWSGLPVIFDEVFTGLYRLGRFSSASFLDAHPDISVHAKLLTGGLLPLCVTLASEDIFNAFSSKHKMDALLHGHSYTAHAVGCKVAETSLRTMIKMEEEGHWEGFVNDWSGGSRAAADQVGPAGHRQHPGVWSSWSQQLVRDLSYAESVNGVFALGSVLSIALRDQDGAGYNSNAAASLQRHLGMATSEGFNVHSRVLGNVLYLMSSLTSKPDLLRMIEKALRSALL